MRLLFILMLCFILAQPAYAAQDNPQDNFPDEGWSDEEFDSSTQSQSQQQSGTSTSQQSGTQTQAQESQASTTSTQAQESAAKDEKLGPIEEKGWYGQTEDKPWYWQVKEGNSSDNKTKEVE